MDSLPEPPADGNYLAWVTKNPREVAAYLERVKAFERLELVVTSGGVTKRATVKFGKTTATLEISL